MALQFDVILRTAMAQAIQTRGTQTTKGAWTASTAYTVGETVSNGGNNYICTTAGTSATSGGPTGTGTGITDGTAVWSYAPPTLVFYSGTEPASCATALSGNTVLDTIDLPMTFFTAASGADTLAGTWSATAAAAGTASFFRFLDAAGTCFMQGTVGTSGADLNLSSTALSSGIVVTITSDTITIGGA